MASSDEYQQRRSFEFNENAYDAIVVNNTALYESVRKKYRFRNVKGISGEEVRLFIDDELNRIHNELNKNITNGNNRDSKESV